MASKLNPWNWNWDAIGVAVIWIVGIFVILFATSAAKGSDCHQFFYRKAVVQQVVAYAAPVYYQAGVSIENDALAAKVAKIVVSQLRAELKAAPLPQQQVAQTQSAVAQHCAKCHSGATPKAGIVYDGQTSLDCWQVTSALRAIRDNTMPKDHKIAPEVKGALMEELLNLEQAADRPRPVQVQAPEQTGELR